MVWRFFLVIGRLAAALYFLLTSVYCLLAWIPFTYQQVVKGRLLPALSVFVIWHPKIYWAVLGVVAASLARDVGERRTRAAALGFLVTHAAGGIWLLRHPLLAGLHNEIRSFYWSLAALAPLVWLAAIDWLASWRNIQWAGFRNVEDNYIFHATWQSALFLAVVYSGASQLRSTVRLGVAGDAAALAASVVSHLTALFAFYVGLQIVRSIAGLMPRPSPAEFVLSNVLAGGVVWAAIRVLVFGPISFSGRLAAVSAAALAGAIMATVSGLGLRLWRNQAYGPAGGLALAVLPLSLGRFRGPLAQASKLAAIAAMAAVLAVKTAALDWNDLVQKLGVLAVWALTFSSIYVWHAGRAGKAPVPAGAGESHRGRMLVIVVLCIAGYRMTASAIVPRPQFGAVLESYAGFDVSFRMIRDMLSPPPRDDGFYNFLRANTNISRSVHVSPVDVEFVSSLARANREQPNIFIFVIDSLRRDYLSVYNPAVSFTPNLDAFARENTAFRSAFTRYGATGLSEPSIWAGGMILHKQYVTPFYPMNTLEKLIEAEEYQPFISMDTILATVVKPLPNQVDLDHNKLDMDFDFCSTAAELESRLGEQHSGAPVFTYSSRRTCTSP